MDFIKAFLYFAGLIIGIILYAYGVNWLMLLFPSAVGFIAAAGFVVFCAAICAVITVH